VPIQIESGLLVESRLQFLVSRLAARVAVGSGRPEVDRRPEARDERGSSLSSLSHGTFNRS
jgi:hypothetical protein